MGLIIGLGRNNGGALVKPIIVSVLPTASEFTMNKVYLVPSESDTDMFDVYYTTESGGSYSWEQDGSVSREGFEIADNLNTNDATKALSAKQGKVLADADKNIAAQVTELGQLSVDLSNYPTLDGWIRENGTVLFQDGSLHYAVNISPLPTIVRIRSNMTQGARITFAQSINYDGGWTLCSGITSRITMQEGETQDIPIPLDAKYIIIGNRANGTLPEGTATPDNVQFIYSAIVNFVDNKINNSAVECDFNLLHPLAGHIHSTGNRVDTDTNPFGLHYAIPLMGATMLNVTSKAESSSYFVFASAVSGADWTKIGTRIVVDAGQSAKIQVPTGATYLIVGCRAIEDMAVGYYAPAVCKIDVPIGNQSDWLKSVYINLIEKMVGSVVGCDFSKLPTLFGHINSSGDRSNIQTNPFGLHYVAPLMGASVVNVTAKEESASYFVFASAVSGDGWTKIGSRIVVDAGESTVLQVPSDANYLIVGCRSIEGMEIGFFAPAVCLLDVPLKNQSLWNKAVYIDSLADKISKNTKAIESCNRNRLAGGFTLCTYNIGRFSFGAQAASIITQSTYNEYLARYSEIVKEINADILFLNEYNDVFCADYGGSPKYAKDVLFQDYPVRRISEDIDGSLYNVSFFSYRFLSNITKGYFEGDAVRYYIMADYNLNGIPVKIIAMHLPHVNGDDDASSIAVLNNIIQLMTSYDYVIFCGDTNMVANKAHFNVLTNAGYTIANCGDFGDFATYQRNYPNKCIDQIAVKGFKISNVRMIEVNYASDHYPLVCDLVMTNY